ncbi:hypothetical protein ABT297_21555 [Dactylosporangium sp. NPDC000555]|uniref:hypothetical protein n=1 Tax=Dactylosporangium sp. NPDC000555 TaxID=3154260 RepID=UPI003316869D
MTHLVKRIAALPGDPVPPSVLPAVGGRPGDVVPPGKLVVIGDGIASADSRRPGGHARPRHWGYATLDRVLGVMTLRASAAAFGSSLPSSCAWFLLLLQRRPASAPGGRRYGAARR